MTTRINRLSGRSLGLALLCLAASCSYEAKGSYRTSGSEVSSGNIGFSSGGVETSADRPSFIFGTTRGAGLPEFSYIIAVNQPDRDTQSYSASSSGSASFTAGDYEASHLFDLDGYSVRVEHTAKIEAITKVVSDERLMVQGAPVDLSKGRLILLGDGVAASRWIQISDPLPSAPSDLPQLPEFAAATVTNLAQTNGVIKTFLGR